jgi:hypothetical protein
MVTLTSFSAVSNDTLRVAGVSLSFGVAILLFEVSPHYSKSARRNYFEAVKHEYIRLGNSIFFEVGNM